MSTGAQGLRFRWPGSRPSRSAELQQLDRVVVRHAATHARPQLEAAFKRARELRAERVRDHRLVTKDGKPPEPWTDLLKVLKLARRPNAVIKVSGACTLSREPYPFADIWDPLARLFDAWGFDRCLWGTDWTRLSCSWREAITLFTEELPWLDAESKEWEMGRALCEWLGWPLPR